MAIRLTSVLSVSDVLIRHMLIRHMLIWHMIPHVLIPRLSHTTRAATAHNGHADLVNMLSNLEMQALLAA